MYIFLQPYFRLRQNVQISESWAKIILGATSIKRDAGFLQKWRRVRQTIVMILDTTKDTQHRRGRIRQVS